MLQEDLIEADRYSAFERAQLEEVMSSSINGNSATSNSNSTSVPSLQDDEVDPTVLHTIEMLNSNDRKLADALSKDLGASARDHQMAQKLGAENSKLALDAEYARQLQGLDETGRHDLDWDHLKNLEGVIGKEQIKEIMVSFIDSEREEGVERRWQISPRLDKRIILVLNKRDRCSSCDRLRKSSL